MTNYAKYFFLRKLDEVELRMASGDYFDMIMAAGLLRHLVLDEVPLIHRANRDLRLKLEFIVSPSLKPIPDHLPKPVFYMPNIDPDTAPQCYRTETVSLDKLLGYHILTTRGEDFTVKDILKNCAHVRGGIHLDEPNERDNLLFEADGIEIGGAPSAMLALRQIANILLKGLMPLGNAVHEQLYSSGVGSNEQPN